MLQMTRAALGVLAALMMLDPDAVLAQRNRGEYGRMRGMLGDANEFYQHPEFRGNTPYDGRFTFARIKWRGFGHFTNQGPGWSHDYPRAESHLMRIMMEITSLRPFIESDKAVGGNVLALDDPDLFKYPVAYLSEPGAWFPNGPGGAGPAQLPHEGRVHHLRRLRRGRRLDELRAADDAGAAEGARRAARLDASRSSTRSSRST